MTGLLGCLLISNILIPSHQLFALLWYQELRSTTVMKCSTSASESCSKVYHMGQKKRRLVCLTQNYPQNSTPRPETYQSPFRDDSGLKAGLSTAYPAPSSKVEGSIRHSLTCESNGAKWVRDKKQTFGGTMRQDVANACLNLTNALSVQTPSAKKGYLDVNRKQGRGRFVGGTLSTAR